ncbi:MAG: tRNA 4-thiouridine(8) synthase ThiI [Candidatus Paceibacterota bacterium]
MKKKKIRGILLFSGGLDSLLALKIAERLNIKPLLLIFKSYFFDERLALKAIKENKITWPYRVIDISKEHFQLVKKPRFGYGKNMNPCLDCHLLMLKIAKKIKDKEKFDLVITGEVLGERPMSQNLSALKLLEKKAKLKGYLLRPLSALLLEPTVLEKKGLIDRSKLLGIFSRSRKEQLELARKFALKWFPTPSGGCLLTDPSFSSRLAQLFKIAKRIRESDLELLKIGRHFLNEGKDWKAKIIIGRNHQENEKLKALKEKKDILIELENYPGPTAFIRSYQGKISQNILEEAKELILRYAHKAQNKKDVRFRFI